MNTGIGWKGLEGLKEFGSFLGFGGPEQLSGPED
jgi:hypothetical protein